MVSRTVLRGGERELREKRMIAREAKVKSQWFQSQMGVWISPPGPEVWGRAKVGGAR
jgi:hypothetical protein